MNISRNNHHKTDKLLIIQQGEFPPNNRSNSTMQKAVIKTTITSAFLAAMRELGIKIAEKIGDGDLDI